VTVVRDRKIRTALRTNQNVGFVTVPAWKKIKVIIELSYSKFLPRKVLREVVQSVERRTGLAVVAFPLGRIATFLLKSRGIFPNKTEQEKTRKQENHSFNYLPREQACIYVPFAVVACNIHSYY